jgi:hypothetical protein
VIVGVRPVALPHAALARVVPVYDALREPHRLAMAGLVGLCLLAGLATARVRDVVATIWPRRATAVAAVGAAALIFAMYRQHQALVAGTAPYPIAAPPPRESAIVRALQTRRGTVLELPAPIAPELTGALPEARATYRSIFHWRPLVNGYDGYYPTDFFARLAVAQRLPDPDALAVLRTTTGLETVVVHLAELSVPRRRAWEAATTDPASGLVLAAREGNVIVVDVARRVVDLDARRPRSEADTRRRPTSTAGDKSRSASCRPSTPTSRRTTSASPGGVDVYRRIDQASTTAFSETNPKAAMASRLSFMKSPPIIRVRYQLPDSGPDESGWVGGRLASICGSPSPDRRAAVTTQMGGLPDSAPSLVVVDGTPGATLARRGATGREHRARHKSRRG